MRKILPLSVILASTLVSVATAQSVSRPIVQESKVLYQSSSPKQAGGTESYDQQKARLMQQRDQQLANEKRKQDQARAQKTDSWKAHQSQVRHPKSK